MNSTHCAHFLVLLPFSLLQRPIPDIAKNAKLVIVPDKPNDVGGVVATAMGIAKTIDGSSLQGGNDTKRAKDAKGNGSGVNG